jgi:hypothetical protein
VFHIVHQTTELSQRLGLFFACWLVVRFCVRVVGCEDVWVLFSKRDTTYSIYTSPHDNPALDTTKLSNNKAIKPQNNQHQQFIKIVELTKPPNNQNQ